MGRHTFPSLILYPPSTMVNRLVTVGLAKASVTFPRAMGVCPPSIRMHGVEEVRNVVGGSDVDVTQSGISAEVLEMKERV